MTWIRYVNCNTKTKVNTELKQKIYTPDDQNEWWWVHKGGRRERCQSSLPCKFERWNCSLQLAAPTWFTVSKRPSQIDVTLWYYEWVDGIGWVGYGISGFKDIKLAPYNNFQRGNLAVRTCMAGQVPPQATPINALRKIKSRTFVREQNV